MKKLIDNIANWLVGLKERKDTIDQDTTTFLKRGNNFLLVWSLFFGSIFIYFSVDLYLKDGKLLSSLIPLLLFVLILFVGVISDAYRKKLKQRNRNTRMKLVGFNMDFNERILERIFNPLIRYEYLDENLTTFGHFHDVMVLDFDEHVSVLHFSCTQAELKYILEKFKPFKKGLGLAAFERSGKIYNKGKLISAESLSKSYNKNPPTKEFENLIDSFFDFLGDI
ncbi:hypothetical protein B0O79_3381 [Flavobacteriaceae bacterium MAR_2009_75]|nr:hypothetical protein B0O79_3381 [Flavobacteriaceae bacterium MAR_2009_75]